MNYKYYIQNIRQMPKRSGNSFATTYYKALKEENEKLFDYVTRIIEGIKIDLEEDILYNTQDSTLTYTSALPPKHKHLDGERYTMIEVVLDLYTQLKTNKDPTESMVNRWNVIFDEMGCEDGCIKIKVGSRPKEGEFKIVQGLFE